MLTSLLIYIRWFSLHFKPLLSQLLYYLLCRYPTSVKGHPGEISQVVHIYILHPIHIFKDRTYRLYGKRSATAGDVELHRSFHRIAKLP
jgi:hypothetical protein